MKKISFLILILIFSLLILLISCGDDSGSGDDDDDNNDTQPEIPTEGLIHCYLFDGNAQDTGSDPHHGTVNGAVLCTGHNGGTDSAYSFDGSSTIDLDYTLAYGSCTFSLWIKTAEFEGSFIFWKENPSGIGSEFLSYKIFNGYITCTFAMTGMGGSNISGTTLQNNDTWAHVVFTIDDTDALQIYVNGLLETSDTLGSMDINTLIDIGSSFTGSIDDIYIYNRVLSTEEIGILLLN